MLVDQKGKAIVFGGAPNLGFSIANGESPFNPLTLVDGPWPHGNEVVIDKSDRRASTSTSATRSASRRKARSRS